MKSNEPPSRKWQTMKHDGKGNTPMDGAVRCEYWENALYSAYVHHFDESRMARVVIGVCRADQTAVHDWRDLQWLKNDIVGEEWEAVEVYPSESCKVDPSNYYYLFCFPPGLLLSLGIGLTPPRRNVVGPTEAMAPQRAFKGGVR